MWTSFFFYIDDTIIIGDDVICIVTLKTLLHCHQSNFKMKAFGP